MSFLSSFPLDSPRDGQITLFGHLDRTTESTALIHIAPTGIGKSAVAVTVGNHSGSAFIISPNRNHVDQYEKEYPHLCVGRSAADHKCLVFNYADKSCQYAAKKHEKYCEECPYVRERNAYLKGPVSVSTIAYLIARVQHPVKDHPLIPREWLVIDEIHKLEEDLIRHSGLTIRAEDCNKFGIEKIPIPAAASQTKSKYKETTRRDVDGSVIIPYVRERLLPALVERVEFLSAKVCDKDQEKELDRLASLVERIPYYFDLDPSEIVAWVDLDPFQFATAIQVKPFSVADLYHRLIEPMGNRMLGLSATIPSVKVLASRLGLPASAPGEKSVCRVPSPFPPENHTIKYINCGLMTYEQQPATIEKMIPVIAKILKRHKGERGIIHGHTNKLSHRLRKEFGDRLIFAASSGVDVFSHAEALKRHRKRKDSVLISPSMTEGVDLTGDDSVFQILIKTPFAPLSDPWIAAHKEAPDGSLWDSSQTASIITQALGRSLRTMMDRCSSYILDGSFEAFFRRFAFGTNFPNSHFFPEPLRSLLQAALDEECEDWAAELVA